MALSEFELIQYYFSKPLVVGNDSDVVYGIGDDCAILAPRTGCDLVISVDTLVADVHFPSSASPYDIACRSLAVNVSDLAAMGADPAWFTLALTLPESNASWLSSFSEGLFDAAKQYGMPLVGGDTTRGPLSITIQVHGYVPKGQALRRDAAKIGDDIYVTGYLGQAGAGLALIQQEKRAPVKALFEHFYRPESRIAIGQALLGKATAAIDVSDGLVADLGHIIELSNVGANVYLDNVPYSDDVLQTFGQEQALQFALGAGDDYELCFCASPESSDAITALVQEYSVPITCIGKICEGKSVTLLNKENQPVSVTQQGYQHF